jgi:SAM-dependent methyltransferase
LNIINEYLKQQTWRNWDQYFQHIPIRKDDRVIDFGCSVGGVSNLLSSNVASVTGIDLSADFINYCLSNKKQNQRFICSDFTKVDYSSIPSPTGVWASFSLSYLKDPGAFLRYMYELIEPGGWIALVDVSNFISGNMLPDCEHYEKIYRFENESIMSGMYDFNFGAKMESILRTIGFEIIYVDNNVSDIELNFSGAANVEILTNWRARLERMQGLRARFPTLYPEITKEVLESLESGKHCKNNNVRFVVAKKTL